MTSKTWTGGTVIDSLWLQDVNDTTYGLPDTSSIAKGDALVGVKRTAIGAVATTVHNWIEAQPLNVVSDFGADNTGAAACDSAIAAASAAAGNGGMIYFPAGSYKITSGVSNAYSGQRWVGAGSKATLFVFAPTANGTCVQLGAGVAETVRAGIKGIGFYSSDSTYKKVALDVAWCSEPLIEDIAVGGSVVVSGTLMWSGATSVGLRTRGHEAARFRDITIAADVPIQISQGYSRASYANIDIDHFNFHNLYLLANANPCVLIDSGVNLTQVSFTGQQAWVLGTAGIKWVDTTTSIVGNGLVIENLRTEQGTDATAYSIDLEHNTGLYNVVLRNPYLDPGRKGVKLRKVNYAVIDQAMYGGSLECLNVDSTVNVLDIRDCYWQAGSTASISGQRIIRSAPFNPNSAPLSHTVLYDVSSNTKNNEIHDGVLSATAISVANGGGVANLGPTGTTAVIVIATSIGTLAMFSLNGTNNTTSELLDPAGQFSAAKGTAGSTNVYWDAGNARYEIQNNSGTNPMKYVIVQLGSGTVVA